MTRGRRVTALSLVFTTALGLIGWLGLVGAQPVHAQVPDYSGEAYAVDVALTVADNIGVTARVGDTGQLLAAGGTLNGTVGAVTLPSSLGTANIVTEQTTGANSAASSTSNVASVSILPNALGGPVITATLLNAATSASCSAAPSATSSVGSLSVAGVAVPLTTAPNTVVTVGISPVVIATVTLNQQSTSPGQASASAVIVDFPATGPLAGVIQGRVILSHAESDITECTAAAAPTPAPAPGLPNTGFGG
jgi:hypothetical protein